MPTPIITLLTDFGLQDHYVGVMKGVILGICPEARIVDLSHQITPFQIAQGGFVLAQAWRYFPSGTIHVVVVDPGVGSARRALIGSAGGHLFVAPDNGVLSLALESEIEPTFYSINSQEFVRTPVSNTFHGRDVFAPAAAHLASGIKAGQIGTRLEGFVLNRGSGNAKLASGGLSGTVLHIDIFGNVVTSFRPADLGRPGHKGFQLRCGNCVVATRLNAYADADADEIFLIEGSSGYLEISANKASAADRCRAALGSQVEVVWPSGT